MISFLTSLQPILLNLVTGSALIIIPLHLKDAGASTVAITGTLSVTACISALCAWIIGRFLNEKNARPLIHAGTVIMCFGFLGLRFFPGSGTLMQYVWLIVNGLAMSLFCAPWQVFVRKLERGKASGVVHASALYSASWSLGMAVGPFLFSMLSAAFGHDAWQYAYLLDAVLMLVAFFIPFYAERLAQKKFQVAEEPAPAADAALPADDFTGRPDLAKNGWILTLAAFASVAVTKTLLPDVGVDAGHSPFHISLLVAVIYFAHSITSFCLMYGKEWMYKPGRVLLFSGFCAAGLLCVTFFLHCLSLLYLAAALIGMYSGLVGFCLVFYSLAHPAKAARYVAVNEIVVGMTNMLSPLVIGSGLVLLTHWSGTPFLFLLIPVCAAGWYHWSKTK